MIAESNAPKIHEYTPDSLPCIKFEITGGVEPGLVQMIDFALGRLTNTLGDEAIRLIADVTIKIGSNLTEGGGQALTDQNLILLNYDKMKLSLQEGEDLLVRSGYFEAGERTRTLSEIKDLSDSTIVYELIHELGHIVGERTGYILDTSLSPTKYGRIAKHEAFAEAFTYYVLGAKLGSKAKDTMQAALATQ